MTFVQVIFMTGNRFMTPIRVTLALLLVIVAVLLAAVYAGEQSCPPQTTTAPWITIDPVSDHVVGDMFLLTGKTNLDPGTVLSVYIIQPPYTGNSCRPSGFGGDTEVRVTTGNCGVNTWIFEVNLSGAEPLNHPDQPYVPGYSVDVRNTSRHVVNHTEIRVFEKPSPPLSVERGAAITLNRTTVVEFCPLTPWDRPTIREPVREVRIWVFGKNSVNISSVPVNPDGSYTVTLDPAMTTNLTSGTYTLIVQYPLNNSFEIGPRDGTGRVFNEKGEVVFDKKWVDNGIISGNTALLNLNYELTRPGVTDTWNTIILNITDPVMPVQVPRISSHNRVILP